MTKIYNCVFYFIIIFTSYVNLNAQDEPTRQWVQSQSGQIAYPEENKFVVRVATTNEYYVVGNGGGSNFIYVIKYNSTGAQVSTFNYVYKSSGYNSIGGAHLDASNNLILLGETNNSDNLAIGFIAKFNTSSGTNALMFENTFSLSDLNFGRIGLLKTFLPSSSAFVYLVGQESNDTIWVSKLNAQNGNTEFVKKIKRYTSPSISFNITYTNYVLRDVIMDNNRNIILVGSVNYKSVPAIFIGPTVRRDDGFAFKLDSNGINATFGTSQFPLMDNSTINDTLGNSMDVATHVVTDNANNVYVAVERNDSSGFNKGSIYIYKYSGGGTLASGWPIIIGSSSNSQFKESGICGGLRLIGNNLYITYQKDNFYKSATTASGHRGAGMGIAKVDISAGTITWNNTLPLYSSGTSLTTSVSQTQISMPFIDDLSSNLFYAYRRSAFSFLASSSYSIQIQKVNIGTGSPTVQSYINSQGATNNINIRNGIVDGNGVPIIVGSAYYNSSRDNDGLIFKPNTANTSIAFEDYFNQIVNSYSEARNLGYNISPVAIGTTSTPSTSQDIYIGIYNPANGSVTSTVIDKGSVSNALIDSKVYNSAAYVLSSKSGETSLYVDVVSTTGSTIQRVFDDITGLNFIPTYVDLHTANTSGTHIYVSGTGPGGDVSIRKYSSTTSNTLIDSINPFSTTTYSNTSIRHILFRGDFAYVVAYQNFASSTTPDRNIFERINVANMTFSSWSLNSTVFSNLRSVVPIDFQINSSKNLFSLISGRDTSGGSSVFKYRLSRLDTNFIVSYNTDVTAPSGTSIKNCLLNFNPNNGNPVLLITLSNNQVLLNEYSLTTGTLISSNNYPNNIPGVSSIYINKSISSASNNALYLAYSLAQSNGVWFSGVASIDFTTKALKWTYTNPEIFSYISSLAVTPTSGRVYAAGSRPIGSINTIGSELFVEKLCDIDRPLLSTGNISYCANNVSQILTTNYNSGIVWSNGATTSSITPPSSGNYFNTYTAADACFKNSDTISVTIKGPINKDICFTSFDKNQNKILVYFDEFSSAGADSVIIYRDFGANNFQRVGSVTADSTWWQDNTLGTTISQALAYKIQIKDTCGQVGALSVFHKPVFVTSFPNVVAGANTMNFEIYQRQAFPGLPNKYFNLMGYNSITSQWDSVASIAAPTSPAQLSFQIVFTPSTQQLSTYGSDYRIDAKLDTGAFKCTIANYSAKGIMQQAKATQGGPSHSNLRTISVGIPEVLQNASIITYPNPSTNGIFNVSSSTNETLTYEILNTSGQVLLKGQFNKHTLLDLQSVSSGVYVLSISDGKYTTRQQIVK